MDAHDLLPFLFVPVIINIFLREASACIRGTVAGVFATLDETVDSIEAGRKPQPGDRPVMPDV
ncbi:hypothetical protein [Rhizobium sp. NFR07]|uniref:hypothetical protein n=1 Tax=Rhizobium sp. NFR07 TaxID=1566262 RepID=UPI001160DBD1|nr:hypothetical protein [Rhizobium sp. NFR07]